jgi:DNA invertase Pin-like site-specific DNA recombinase
MGHVLGYARVSTGDQDLEGQRQRLKKAGAIRIFEDIMSGRRFERPGLAQLLDYARTGDCLCVVRLDRLGRSLRELLEVVDLLKERGIHFQSLEEKIDTSSAAGELIFHVFGAIAHFERRLIGERTKDGLAAAKAKGRRPGRPPVDRCRLQADRGRAFTDRCGAPGRPWAGNGLQTKNAKSAGRDGSNTCR